MSEAHRFPPPSQEEQDRLFKQYGTISLTVLNPSATGGRGRMWAMICGPKSEPDGERWIVQLGDGRACRSARPVTAESALRCARRPPCPPARTFGLSRR
jgi:hypothetical protein